MVAREDGPGGKRLVAFFVGKPSGAELRTFLRSRLPAHMVPALFLELPSLPLTLNRKVDRQALAQLALPMGSIAGDVQAPRNPTEELLAGSGRKCSDAGGWGSTELPRPGGDSPARRQIQARTQVALELDLPPSVVVSRRAPSPHWRSQSTGLSPSAPRAPRDDPAAASGNPGASRSPRRRGSSGLSNSSCRGRRVNTFQWYAAEGALAPAVLERCLTEDRTRHRPCGPRSSPGPNGEPLQLDHRLAVWLPPADLSGRPSYGSRVSAERLAQEEAGAPLDPNRSALCASACFEWRRTSTTCCSPSTMSSPTAHRSSVRARAGSSSTRFPPRKALAAPPLTVQPADVAAWERDGLSAEVLAPHALLPGASRGGAGRSSWRPTRRGQRCGLARVSRAWTSLPHLPRVREFARQQEQEVHGPPRRLGGGSAGSLARTTLSSVRSSPSWPARVGGVDRLLRQCPPLR